MTEITTEAEPDGPMTEAEIQEIEVSLSECPGLWKWTDRDVERLLDTIRQRGARIARIEAERDAQGAAIKAAREALTKIKSGDPKWGRPCSPQCYLEIDAVASAALAQIDAATTEPAEVASP